MSLKTSEQTSKQWKIPLLGHKDADWWRKTVCLWSSFHYHVYSVKWSLKCCQEEYRNDSSGMRKFLTAQDTFFFLFEAESHDFMILLPQSRLPGLHVCHGTQFITGHSLKTSQNREAGGDSTWSPILVKIILRARSIARLVNACCKHLDLIRSQNPHLKIKSKHCGTHLKFQCRGDRDRHISGAHWPVSLAYLRNYRPPRELLSQKLGGRYMNNDTRVESLSST